MTTIKRFLVKFKDYIILSELYLGRRRLQKDLSHGAYVKRRMRESYSEHVASNGVDAYVAASVVSSNRTI